VGGAVLLVLLAVMAVRGVSPGDYQEFQTTAYALESAAVGPVPEPALACVVPLQLKRGQTLEKALLAAGLDMDRVAALAAELGEWVDLRRLRPRDQFLLYTSRGGEVRRLEYQGRPEERVVLEEVGGMYRGYREREPVQRLLRKITGTVDDNLYFSVSRAGGNPALVVDFADLFAWDFDFFTDTRRGDRFEILVEENRVNGERIGFGRILAGRYHPHRAKEPLEGYYYTWNDGKDDGYYDANGRSLRKFFLKSPLHFRRISSHFSHKRFHPILKRYRPHLGIDYAAPMGTPVVALGNGKVVFAGWKSGFGRTVQIKHNQIYLTQYAHLRGYAKGLRSGVRVKQGQTIGYVGSSGLSTGPHLDFRVRANGRWINPLRLKGGKSEPLPKKVRGEFAQNVKRISALLDSLQRGEAALYTDLQRFTPEAASARLDTLTAS
jgi:murein DD-endopeptidase MepM/ murein hydrolase activator NlpD